MTKALTKQGTRISEVARIRGVRLVEGSGKVRFRDVDEVPDDADIAIAHNGQIAAPPGEDGAFFVLATADVRVVPPDKKGEPFLSVRAVFELAYRLPSGFVADRGELDAFAGVNGVFNAWPYFREFVQSMTTRMNVPPIVLPLFRSPKQKVGKALNAETPDAKAAGEEKTHESKRSRQLKT